MRCSLSLIIDKFKLKLMDIKCRRHALLLS